MRRCCVDYRCLLFLIYEHLHSSVTFLRSGSDCTGFSLAYPKITLHAISRNADTGNCLYCQIADPSVPPISVDSDEEEDDDEEYEPLREMRLYVKDDASRKSRRTEGCDFARTDSSVNSRSSIQRLYGLRQLEPRAR